MPGLYKKQLTPEQALQKLKHYCAYQERSHKEVRQKLYDLGVWKKDHDQLIATLIEENYLNEERFAIAYAGGKFRMKKWGRVRITYELQQRQVSAYSIRKALKQIEEQDYLATLQELATDKYAALRGEQYLIRQKKTTDYLVAKGYEHNLVKAAMDQLTAKK